jgi:hypothetical protein
MVSCLGRRFFYSLATNRLGRARRGPRRPGNLSGVARRTARDRNPRPRTGVGHEASKPRERPTGTRPAPTPEKRHRRGGPTGFGNAFLGPGRTANCSRAAHKLGSRGGSAIDRAIRHADVGVTEIVREKDDDDGFVSRQELRSSGTEKATTDHCGKQTESTEKMLHRESP